MGFYRHLLIDPSLSLLQQSIRLFARIAYLLTCLCSALSPDLIPSTLLSFVETIFSTTRRLWGRWRARVTVRPEVERLLRKHQASQTVGVDTAGGNSTDRRCLLRKQVE